ncbi:MAG: hypothetical protein ACLUNZ_08030 [Evtepia sp.]
MAVLRELKAGKWPENAKKVGDYFAAELAKMPHVTAVRHRGLFVGVVLEDMASTLPRSSVTASRTTSWSPLSVPASSVWFLL